MSAGLFLSCLSGSKAGQASTASQASFLSCLSGSKADLRAQLAELQFLSCLSGSKGEVNSDNSRIFKEKGRNRALKPK